MFDLLGRWCVLVPFVVFFAMGDLLAVMFVDNTIRSNVAEFSWLARFVGCAIVVSLAMLGTGLMLVPLEILFRDVRNGIEAWKRHVRFTLRRY